MFIEDIHEEVGDGVFGGLVAGISAILFREISEGRTTEIGRIVPDLVDFVLLPLEAVRARRARRDPEAG